MLYRFSKDGHGAMLDHDLFKWHMEEEFWRIMDQQLLSELTQAYSMVVPIGSRAAEFHRAINCELVEKPVPIKLDGFHGEKLNGRYRLAALVNNEAKFRNESTDRGVSIQFGEFDTKWRVFGTVSECCMVSSQGKYEFANGIYTRHGGQSFRPRYTKWQKGRACAIEFDDQDGCSRWAITPNNEQIFVSSIADVKLTHRALVRANRRELHCFVALPSRSKASWKHVEFEPGQYAGTTKRDAGERSMAA